MQKLSLQLACRYFADSNIFIAGSWCFGALVISLYLLTWGGKDKCALQYLLHLNTYKCLLLGGCFGFLIGFEVMVLISFWLQCFWCNQFFHTQLLCGLELFWEHVSKQIWFKKSTWPGWRPELPSPRGHWEAVPEPWHTWAAQGLLFASDRGAVDTLQELQEWDLWLWREFAKFV